MGYGSNINVQTYLDRAISNLTTTNVLKVLSFFWMRQNKSILTRHRWLMSGPLDWITLVSAQITLIVSLWLCASFHIHEKYYSAIWWTSLIFLVVSNTCVSVLATLKPDAAYSRSLAWHLVELLTCNAPAGKNTAPDKTSSCRHIF